MRGHLEFRTWLQESKGLEKKKGKKKSDSSSVPKQHRINNLHAKGSSQTEQLYHFTRQRGWKNTGGQKTKSLLVFFMRKEHGSTLTLPTNEPENVHT